MFPKYNRIYLIVSIAVVILCGMMFPILSYPIDYRIVLTILLTLGETVVFWAIILAFVNLVLHFDRKRRGYQYKEFGMVCGFSFVPLLFYNILIPLLNKLKSDKLSYAWDINLIRYITSTDEFQILFFLSKLTTVLCVFFFFFLLSFGIRDSFKLELIKAIYLAIFVVIVAYLLSNWLFNIWELF